ncbi:MAG: hypothetical protein OXC05_08365 [Halieaceae bacterium]|nr:hypothetical protein [Halieaceae bacterium]
MPDVLEKALQLQAGLKTWFDSDRYLHDSVPTKNPRPQKAFRGSWVAWIDTEKCGGMWSIKKKKRTQVIRKQRRKTSLGGFTSREIGLTRRLTSSPVAIWKAEGS